MYVPLLLVVGLWVFSYVAYESNVIIVYPESNSVLLGMFFLASVFAASSGYHLGLGKRVGASHFQNYRSYAIIGLVSYLALFLPVVYNYTGNNVSNILTLFLEPGTAYSNMQSQLKEGREGRAWLLVVKILVAPFVLFALPYFAYRFFKFRKDGFYFFLIVFAFFLMSVFRGTDKEVFDVFVWSIAVLIAVRPLFLFVPFRNLTNFKYITIFVLVLVVVFSLFSYKKSNRLGEVETRCYSGTDICYELDRSDATQFVTVMGYSYLTQGYYGLSRAFDADYDYSWGMGHSPSLQYLGAALFDMQFDDNLVSSLDDVGWVSRGQWSTGFVWLGNDIPLAVIPLFIFFAFFLLSWSYREFRETQEILALVVFVYGFYNLLYMPLNLQLPKTGDLYLGYLFLLLVFIFRKRRRVANC
ncbi:hypothetical protein [Guyparkeria sp. SCN-R1]|uniref:hypothetical protein n=1 Tax=Guyparkeria sp. SCN-R1 TaxID=2341113 RepID=UPI000F64D909|nr:hypothetical protein [Guyparkeria sp. SCN-R1]